MTIITAALGILSLLVMIGITFFIVRYIRMANQMRINGRESILISEIRESGVEELNTTESGRKLLNMLEKDGEIERISPDMHIYIEQINPFSV